MAATLIPASVGECDDEEFAVFNSFFQRALDDGIDSAAAANIARLLVGEFRTARTWCEGVAAVCQLAGLPSWADEFVVRGVSYTDTLKTMSDLEKEEYKQ